MKTFGPSFRSMISTVLAAAALAIGTQAPAQTDPLPSWNEGAAKKAIVDFVQATTTQGSPQFVPPAERIAAFDWSAYRFWSRPGRNWPRSSRSRRC
jgi:hypothetical protein